MSLTVTFDHQPPVAHGTTVTMTVASDKRLSTIGPWPVGAGGETVNVSLAVQSGVTFGAGAPTLTPVSDDGHTAVYTFTA